jgi:hypothetical protein
MHMLVLVLSSGKLVALCMSGWLVRKTVGLQTTASRQLLAKSRQKVMQQKG